MRSFDIPDRPVIASIERTGYPPWMRERPEEELDEDRRYEERREEEG